MFLGRAPTGGQSCAHSPPTQGLTRSVANAVQRSNVTCTLTQWALQDATRKSGTQATHLLLITLLTRCNEFRSTTPSLRPVRVRNESPRSLTAGYQFIRAAGSSICNGDFHLDSGLNADGSDLLDDLGRAVQVNEALVDPHLETVPSLRTFPTRGFPRRYSQGLGGHPHRPLHLEILLLRASDQVGTHLLQRLHVAAGESDPNPVDRHLGLHGSLSGVFKSHGCGAAS